MVGLWLFFALDITCVLRCTHPSRIWRSSLAFSFVPLKFDLNILQILPFFKVICNMCFFLRHLFFCTGSFFYPFSSFSLSLCIYSWGAGIFFAKLFCEIVVLSSPFFVQLKPGREISLWPANWWVGFYLFRLSFFSVKMIPWTKEKQFGQLKNKNTEWFRLGIYSIERDVARRN